MRRTEAWSGESRRRRIRAPRMLTSARDVPQVTSPVCSTSCCNATTIVEESRRPCDTTSRPSSETTLVRT